MGVLHRPMRPELSVSGTTRSSLIPAQRSSQSVCASSGSGSVDDFVVVTSRNASVCVFSGSISSVDDFVTVLSRRFLQIR